MQPLIEFNNTCFDIHSHKKIIRGISASINPGDNANELTAAECD